jgi:hypothetical protein
MTLRQGILQLDFTGLGLFQIFLIRDIGLKLFILKIRDSGYGFFLPSANDFGS